MAENKRLRIEEVVYEKTEHGNAMVGALTHAIDIKTTRCMLRIAAPLPKLSPIVNCDANAIGKRHFVEKGEKLPKPHLILPFSICFSIIFDKHSTKECEERKHNSPVSKIL